MAGGNQARHARGHRDRRPPRPPLPPPDYGHKQRSVPLWEKEFVHYVGNISWHEFCENKRYVGPFNNLDHWDDSGAFENFRNVKERFWAHYHGRFFDMPLPDSDLYIDEIDHHCKIDPELVVDLEKIRRLSYDSDNNEVDHKSSRNQSGNWNVNIEKSAAINNWESKLLSKHPDNWITNNSGWDDAQESENWDARIEKPTEINNWESEFLSKPNENWVNSNSDWGDGWESGNWDVHIEEKPAEINNWKSDLFSKSSSDWVNSNSGWGDVVANPSWHASSSNNHYSSNNNMKAFFAGSKNKYQDRSDVSGSKRKGNGRGNLLHRDGRQRNQIESNQQRGDWQDRRGRNSKWRPMHKRDDQKGQGKNGGF